MNRLERFKKRVDAMIADNEFSEQFTGDMDSMDFAYRNELLHFDRVTCPDCGQVFSRKKEETRVTCGVCYNKRIAELVEQNRGNL